MICADHCFDDYQNQKQPFIGLFDREPNPIFASFQSDMSITAY